MFFKIRLRDVWAEFILFALVMDSVAHAQSPAICAEVKIQIKQKAVVTRTAFEATLVISNGGSGTLTNVNVDLEIKDELGNICNDKFEGETNPTVSPSSIGNFSGGGSIPPAMSATGTWLIIPQEEANPTALPKKFTVGGKVTHYQDGVLISVPLYPAPIDVFPDAKLFLRYYLQSPVYSDNPFTQEVEPTIPFNLGLMVRNDGYGPAKKLKIKSAQPTITENKQGLLVAFQIVAAQLGINTIQPCLTIEFGDVPPAETRVARWIMTSTLQGKFINYKATFEHVTGLGNPSLSLIKSVTIYEANHVVLIPNSDALPDFLVNRDIGVTQTVALQDVVPQELHSSVNGDGDLAVASDASVFVEGIPSAQNLNCIFHATVTTPGWNFLRGVEPGKGKYKLAAVFRKEANNSLTPILTGGSGDICNAWTTHQPVPFDNYPDPALTAHRVHILDNITTAGNYDYILTYAPVLEISEIRVNGGLHSRSNTNHIAIKFTNATTLPAQIQDGSVIQNIKLFKLMPAAEEQVMLTADRFSWNPLAQELAMDLTEDGAGPSKKTMLEDANYEIRLLAGAIVSPDGELTLEDGDGVADGIYKFGGKESDYLYRLYGDLTGLDRAVDNRDQNQVIRLQGKSPGDSGVNPDVDLNFDNAINSADLQLIVRFFGGFLLPPQPSSGGGGK